MLKTDPLHTSSLLTSRRQAALRATADHEFIDMPARTPIKDMKASPPDLTRLVGAVRKTKGVHVKELLDQSTWNALSHVLQPHTMAARKRLIHQGEESRSLFLIETGSATVYREHERGRLQLAVLGAGSVVGEGTFFAHIVRSASVETLEPAKVWELSAKAFDDLTRGSPAAALQLCRFVGAVLATRMLSVTGRLSIT